MGAAKSAPLAPPPPAPAQVAAVRRFNRFYTRLVGALDEGHLHTAFALAEARVLYELANRAAPTAAELGRELRLDAGYLSRLLQGLTRKGLVKRKRSLGDGRAHPLTLNAGGARTLQCPRP